MQCSSSFSDIEYDSQLEELAALFLSLSKEIPHLYEVLITTKSLALDGWPETENYWIFQIDLV